MENDSPNDNWIFDVIAGILSYMVLSHVLALKNWPFLLSAIVIVGSIWLSLRITRKVADYLDRNSERRF